MAPGPLADMSQVPSEDSMGHRCSYSPQIRPLRRKGEKIQKKPTTWFGYLPLWSEFVPLDKDTGKIDWAGVVANVGAGLVIGMREALGGIVSASLIFSTADVPELTRMFPFGIGMMWYSTSMGALWYALFGRLMYAYGTAQDVIGILQAVMAKQIAEELVDEPEKIPATALAVICISSVLTGISSFALGKAGLGKFAMIFPSPVTSGFLGAIGFVILRSSLQNSSGVKFQYFYPVSFPDFCKPGALAQVGLQVATVLTIRLGPPTLVRLFPGSGSMEKLSSILFQLLPLFVFHVVIQLAGISLQSLTDAGWLYPDEGSGGILSHWTAYSIADVDIRAVAGTLVQMPPLIVMAVLCTATGALAVTDHFPRHPDGDPSPMETLNFDRELTTVGVSSTLLGLTGGTLTFHTFTAIQLRLDGGTHRLAVLALSLFVFAAFASGIPIGHFIPKWFLSGLFMNTAFHFLRGALLSYKAYPRIKRRGIPVPSMQYLITLSSILTSIFFTPATAIFTGMVLSISLFLVQAAGVSPVRNAVEGDRVLSRTKRPFWEMRCLVDSGSRIVLLYLEGPLFFGSARRLVAVLSAAIAPKHCKPSLGDDGNLLEEACEPDGLQYCILSFARVTVVDPSAARHLKNMKDRAALVGWKVIFCRAKHEVFDVLDASGLITNPDTDYVKFLDGEKFRVRDELSGPVDKDVRKVSTIRRLRWQQNQELRPSSEPDAFAHETDALDFCDERLVTRLCYGGWEPRCEGHGAPSSAPALIRALTGCPVWPEHMLDYRRACFGARLPESAFEDMNGLPPGTMNRLRDHCTIVIGRKETDAWKDVMHFTDGDSIGFILRGAVSMLQVFRPIDEKNMMDPQVQSITFRYGKRLLRRYPPGNVIGSVNFVLKNVKKVVEHGDRAPKAQLSSRIGVEAEIWVLQREAFERLPEDLKAALTAMLCVQLADDAQHGQLQEH